MTGIRARPVRQGRQKRAARITFTLSAPGRVVFVVRGPAPACGVAARFRVRGRRGVNRVRFTGRVGRRTLPAGTYRITARTRGRAPSRPIVVQVGDEATRDRFACSPAAVVIASILDTVGYGNGPDGGGKATDGAAVPKPARKREDSSGVLPAVANRLRELPDALPRPSIPAGTDSPQRLIGLAALALLIFAGLALVVYVLRFLRGPDAT